MTKCKCKCKTISCLLLLSPAPGLCRWSHHHSNTISCLLLLTASPGQHHLLPPPPLSSTWPLPLEPPPLQHHLLPSPPHCITWPPPLQHHHWFSWHWRGSLKLCTLAHTPTLFIKILTTVYIFSIHFQYCCSFCLWTLNIFLCRKLLTHGTHLIGYKLL